MAPCAVMISRLMPIISAFMSLISVLAVSSRAADALTAEALLLAMLNVRAYRPLAAVQAYADLEGLDPEERLERSDVVGSFAP